MEENNRVLLVGTVNEDLTFSHETCGEKFFNLIVATRRTSGVMDLVPVLVSEKVVDANDFYYGKTVQIMGEYRSRNTEKGNLTLNVFANSFEVVADDTEHINEIYLEGFICKTPVFRTTPLGRQISELLVAVNRRYNKSDYIPCITWGRNACFASRLDIGAKIAIEGRIQSREYKKVVDGNEVFKTAYEISIGWLHIIENGKGESE